MTGHCNLQTSQEIKLHADQIVHGFVQCIAPDAPPSVQSIFCKSSGHNRTDHVRSVNRPIRAALHNGTLELLICPGDLLGIPSAALQGWLELEVARAMIEPEADLCRFNFRDQIQPLMRLAGGSLYYVRELVEYLSRSLIRRIATERICRIDRALPQVHYYFYTAVPTPEERKFYTKYAPHNWMRASHLCNKLIEYMGLSYLADHDIGFSRALCNEWIKQHGYLPDDQVFFDKMIAVANHFAELAFSVQLVEMFIQLRDTLLLNTSHRGLPPEPGINN